MADEERVTLLEEAAVERILLRMAREIVERNDGTDDLVLLGIQRRGVQLAERIREVIEREEGTAIPSGALDITLYRDDLAQVGPRPVVGESNLPIEGVDDKAVVVIDDVLFTGRTARAAMNELMDRGGRELPIQPDIVGRRVSVLPRQIVDVRVPEVDGRLAVEIATPRREADE